MFKRRNLSILKSIKIYWANLIIFSEVLSFKKLKTLNSLPRTTVRLLELPATVLLQSRGESARMSLVEGFSILTDKDLSLSMSNSMGLVLSWTGTAVRYMMVNRSDIGRFVKEILRLMQAISPHRRRGFSFWMDSWLWGHPHKLLSEYRILHLQVWTWDQRENWWWKWKYKSKKMYCNIEDISIRWRWSS